MGYVCTDRAPVMTAYAMEYVYQIAPFIKMDGKGILTRDINLNFSICNSPASWSNVLEQAYESQRDASSFHKRKLITKLTLRVRSAPFLEMKGEAILARGTPWFWIRLLEVYSHHLHYSQPNTIRTSARAPLLLFNGVLMLSGKINARLMKGSERQSTLIIFPLLYYRAFANCRKKFRGLPRCSCFRRWSLAWNSWPCDSSSYCRTLVQLVCNH